MADISGIAYSEFLGIAWSEFSGIAWSEMYSFLNFDDKDSLYFLEEGSGVVVRVGFGFENSIDTVFSSSDHPALKNSKVITVRKLDEQLMILATNGLHAIGRDGFLKTYAKGLLAQRPHVQNRSLVKKEMKKGSYVFSAI